MTLSVSSIAVARSFKLIAMVATTFALLLASEGCAQYETGLPTGQAQTCVPSQNPDWMVNTLLNRLSPLYNPGAAAVRPGDCQLVEQSPPDFSWPHLSGAVQYQVTLTYPDNHTKTLSAPRNWINWDEVLPSGTYSWQVQAGTQSSNVRRFTVSANSVPFVVPDMAGVMNRLLAKPHPRGLPDPATLALMAGQRAGAPLANLRDRVNGNLNESLPPAGSEGQGFQYGDKALYSLIAYVYDRTDIYREDAKRRVLNLASWDPRGPTAPNDLESLDVAWVITLGYDWLGPVLAQAEKDQILPNLSTRIGDLYGWVIGVNGWPLDSPVVPPQLWLSPGDSHRNTVAAMVAMMSTLLVGDLPAANTWMQDLLPFALNVASPWSGEEGGYANGTPYGMWDVGTQLSAWYALRWATGIDVAHKAWVRNYGRFLAYFVPATAKTGDPGTPTTDSSTPIGLFGDGFAETQLFEERARFGKGYTHFAPSALACWYASRLAGEDSARIEYMMSPPDTCAANPAFPSGTPNSLYLPSTGWMAMHSDLSYLPRTSVYFKSSPPPFGAYGHQSADQNAFVINAGGERLAIESGYYGEHDAGYNSNHWQYWVKRTKSKNAITFDGGQGQIAFEHQPNPYQITYARYGSITQQQSTADYDIVTGDATDAYNGALTKAVRSLVYLRPGTILVYDNLGSSTARTWEWNIHALNPFTVIDSSRIQITSGTQSLCADILAGPDRQFVPISAPDYSSWGRSNDPTNDVSAAPSDPNAAVQYHGKFVSAQPSAAAEVIALLRVGCGATTASATKTDGIWTVRIGERAVTIDASGTVGVTP
jgi:heparinase II/III-like protein/uncharacterized protein DUF4962